jgi:hypothetical protein
MQTIIRPGSEYTDNDWKLFKSWLKEVLLDNTITVTFTKKDGSIREMTCTLRNDILPEKEISESKITRKQSDTVIPVYDLEKNAWRSFSLKSVIEVRFNKNVEDILR